MTMPSRGPAAIASSTSPPVPAAPESKTQVAFVFVPEVGVDEVGAVLGSAASMSSTTGSSS